MSSSTIGTINGCAGRVLLVSYTSPPTSTPTFRRVCRTASTSRASVRFKDDDSEKFILRDDKDRYYLRDMWDGRLRRFRDVVTKGFDSKEELVESLVIGMDEAQDDTDFI
jgi:hypothetical protein